MPPKLTQEQGTSVGREARHLEMQTLIPLLLRNVFAQIPADKLPDPKFRSLRLDQYLMVGKSRTYGY